MRRIAKCSLVSAALLVGCTGGGGSTDAKVTAPTAPTAPVQSIGLSAATSAVSGAQGTTATVVLTLVRNGGFALGVDLTAEGLPGAVTAAFAPASLPNGTSTSTLTLTVGVAAALAGSTITVRARGAGVTDQTVSVALTITAALDYSIGASPFSISANTGTLPPIAITLIRAGGFQGDVALALTGNPAGVTGTFTPNPVPANSATLNVTIASATVPGTYTLTITGTAAGIANRSATITLTVVSADTRFASWSWCSGSAQPSYFAFRDGATGAWKSVSLSGNRYVFTLTQSTGGVAYVMQYSSTESQVSVILDTSALLDRTNAPCIGSSGTVGGKTVNGTLAGLGANEQANISIGGAQTITEAPFTSFGVTNVPNGAVNLLATRRAKAAYLETPPLKLILQRGISPAAGSTLPVLDFNSSSSFVPATATATVTGIAPGERLVMGSYVQPAEGFPPRAGSRVALFFGDGTGAAAQTMYGLPAAFTLPGDLHSVSVQALGPNGADFSYRQVSHFFQNFADRTVDLGPPLSPPTWTVTATAPSARLKVRGAIQPEYDQSFTVFLTQSQRSFYIQASRAYFSQAATEYEIEVPDFPSGFNSLWGLRAGVSIDASIFATNFSLATLPVSPIVVRSAVLDRLITP